MAENVAELLALADRCETAARPDRELDAIVAATVRLFPPNVGYIWQGAMRPNSPDIGAVECCTRSGTGGPWYLSRAYTASLDAAMTLVPEGHWPEGSLGTHKDQRSSIEIHAPDAFDPIGTGWAATPALALTAAALRARAATLTNDGGDNA